MFPSIFKLTFCLLALLNAAYSQHFFKPTTISTSDVFESRITQTTNWTPIRIYYDFSNISTSPAVLTYLSSTIFKMVQTRLQATVSIRNPTNIAPFSVTNCPDLNIPAAYKTQTTFADLLIFVQLYTTSDNTIAYASPCLFAQTDSRPTVGMIHINLSYLKWGADQIDATISTCLHESLHVMIISPVLYGNYPTSNNKTYFQTTKSGVNGTTQAVTSIGSAGLLAFAQTYFACPSMTGVFLENQGGTSSVGSHWNKLLLGNELMTSQRTGYPAFSLFMFYLMNDSGWYQLDFSTADDITWGKYAGCNFVNTACNLSFREFCQVAGQLSCSVDYRAKTVCTQSLFTPGCYYNEYLAGNICSNTVNFSFTSVFEEPGSNSRCFNVLINNAVAANCFQFVCTNNGIAFQVQAQTYTCVTNNQVIVVNSQLTVNCPNVNDFCNLYQNTKCPNDCNGRGMCSVVGVCQCNYFYSGISCETLLPCRTGDQSICSILKQKGLPLVAQMMGAIGILRVGLLSFGLLVFKTNK